VNIVMPVATAMSVAATIGVVEIAAEISATPAMRYATAPSAHRPIFRPKRAESRSVTTPPSRSPGMLTINGSPAKMPRLVASNPCRSRR
jgi:hypothetical protein